MKPEHDAVSAAAPPNGAIRIYTTLWCADCHRAKWFLKGRGIAFEEIRIDESEDAMNVVLRANHGKRRVPTFEVNGRTFHCSPYDPHKLARELGLDEEGR